MEYLLLVKRFQRWYNRAIVKWIIRHLIVEDKILLHHHPHRRHLQKSFLLLEHVRNIENEVPSNDRPELHNSLERFSLMTLTFSWSFSVNLFRIRWRFGPVQFLTNEATQEMMCSERDFELRKEEFLCQDFQPSFSALVSPERLFPLGGLMNNGNNARNPRISTIFWQLSFPSVPVIAKSNVLNAPFRDAFLSLNVKRKTNLSWFEHLLSYLSMIFIKCGPSPLRNRCRFGANISDEHRQLKRFSMYSNSSLVCGSCRL